MQRTLDVDAPLTLAKCRRAGTVLNLPLHELKSRTEAEAFQRAAVIALGGETCGHKIGATSIEVQRLLKCQEPIHAPILREHVLASGTTDRIPAGLLGIECEFGFLMDRDCAISAEFSDTAALRSVIAECFVALEIVGRRIDDVPLDEVSSIADFALDVAVVRGEPIPDWEHQASPPACSSYARWCNSGERHRSNGPWTPSECAHVAKQSIAQAWRPTQKRRDHPDRHMHWRHESQPGAVIRRVFRRSTASTIRLA